MDCKSWDEMVAFMKSVSPKDGVGVMAYTLSKLTMNYYTSLKAVELGKRGIRVNALLPGSTDTGMKKEFEKMAGGQDNPVSYTHLDVYKRQGLQCCGTAGIDLSSG